MRLLFLSNTRGNSNQGVLSRIRLWLPENAKIGFIPSAPDPAGGHFKEVGVFFRDISPSFKLGYIDIHNEREKPKHLERQLRKCDAVYLSGGNTFRFLKAIRDSHMDSILERFAGEKVFIGTSAGGLIMTLNIELASGENDIGLENTRGLALVKFGFYPHFIPESPEQLREINSCIGEFPEIYALPEFSGLAVTEIETIPLGPVYRFIKGIKEYEIVRSTIRTTL
jgi:dipeptidase E